MNSPLARESVERIDHFLASTVAVVAPRSD
jgi:hypothetical protein